MVRIWAGIVLRSGHGELPGRGRVARAARISGTGRGRFATVPAVDDSYGDHLQHVRDSAREELHSGFVTRDELVEGMRELVEYDPDCPVPPDEAERVVEELWARRQAELASAPAGTTTDDQRLDAAFADLRAAGLVARMHCGFDQGEALDECAEAAAADGGWGFVYFHQQDARRLAGGPDEPLYLGFDTVEPVGRDAAPDPASREEYDRARVLVGRTVVAALTEHGLRSTWDGSAGHRIAVRVPDWRRPLPGS